jgi:repressor of nif and glnA expression
MTGVGTVCSVTLNGILLKAGIPVQSLFGGLLAIEEGTPKRFTEVVHYGWTSLDPVEVFIKSGATSVSSAVLRSSGVVGASFREFPGVARDHALRELEGIRPWGIGGVIAVGSPSSPLLEVDIAPGRCGLVIAAGLNPVAAVEEAGVPTISHALTDVFDYEKLVDVNEVSA